MRRAAIAPEAYRAIYQATASRLRAAQVELAGHYLAAPEGPEKLAAMGRITTVGAMLHEIEAIRI